MGELNIFTLKTIQTLAEPGDKILGEKLAEGLKQVEQGETYGPFDSADDLFEFLDSKNAD